MLIYLFIPHFFLIFSALVLLILNAVMVRRRSSYGRLICEELLAQTAFVSFIVLILIINSKVEGFSTDYNFHVGFGKSLTQSVTVIFLLLSLPSIFLAFRSEKLNFFEFFIIILIILVSILFIINSNSLLAIFITIEIFALCSVILASFNKLSALSTESGLKYFISSATFSGIFLLGSSLIYFCYGTVLFDNIHLLSTTKTITTEVTIRLGTEVGMLLVICWLLFKISSAPFHFWVSDVYDGAPLAATIFFSNVPKFALIIFLLKWSKLCFFITGTSPDYLIFIVCGLVSCVFGFISALQQKKLKKLFIFSSVGQMGYIVGATFIVLGESSVSVIFFSLVCLISSVIIWNLISILFALDQRININKNNLRTTPFNLTHLNGLFFKNKPLAFFIAFTIFSLSAIPPMVGFYGKFEIFSAMVNGNVFLPIGVMIVLSSISSYYYMELVRSIFFEGEQNRIKSKENFMITSYDDPTIELIHFMNCLLTIILIFGFFFPEYIISIASIIALSNGIY